MNEEILYKKLNELNIVFEQVEHEAVYTVEDAKKVDDLMEGIGSKNLFLTNKKGKYFLVVFEESKKANIKEIGNIVQEKHLAFASEEKLKEILGVERGSCTPLGIINDKEKETILLIDKDLYGKKLLLPANKNTATISMKYDDLLKFIESEKNQYIII